MSFFLFCIPGAFALLLIQIMKQRNYWRVKTTYINFTSAALKDIEEKTKDPSNINFLFA